MLSSAMTALEELRSHDDTVAVHDSIPRDPAGVPKYRGTGRGRCLSPTIRLRVVTLNEIHVAVVVPAADQIDVAVLVGDRYGIVDRHRHRRVFLVFPTDRVEGVGPWR